MSGSWYLAGSPPGSEGVLGGMTRDKVPPRSQRDIDICHLGFVISAELKGEADRNRHPVICVSSLSNALIPSVIFCALRFNLLFYEQRLVSIRFVTGRYDRTDAE